MKWKFNKQYKIWNFAYLNKLCDQVIKHTYNGLEYI